MPYVIKFVVLAALARLVVLAPQGAPAPLTAPAPYSPQCTDIGTALGPEEAATIVAECKQAYSYFSGFVGDNFSLIKPDTAEKPGDTTIYEGVCFLDNRCAFTVGLVKGTSTPINKTDILSGFESLENQCGAFGRLQLNEQLFVTTLEGNKALQTCRNIYPQP